jgi:phage shock protein E
MPALAGIAFYRQAIYGSCHRQHGRSLKELGMLKRLSHLLIASLLLIMSNSVFANETQNAIWIDVRTSDEFNAGHLQGAIHIPYEEIGARIGEVTTDKNTTIHLYCRSGNRSGIAQQTLQALGFSKALNEGGYEDLKQKFEAN